MEHARVFSHPAPVNTPADLRLQPTPQYHYLCAALANTRSALLTAIGLATGLSGETHGVTATWLDDLSLVRFTLDHMLERQRLLDAFGASTGNAGETGPTPCHPDVRLPQTVAALVLAHRSLAHAITMAETAGHAATVARLAVVAHLLANTAGRYRLLLDLQPVAEETAEVEREYEEMSA